MSTPPIQWYPGHIAKAEKQLIEQLKRVDVVLEVRDARIPLATHHPKLFDWIGNKSRVLVLNRVDMIPSYFQKRWEQWFLAQGEVPYFTDARRGNGIKPLAKATQKAGKVMNQRRIQRGMQPRSIRAVVIGFPNVGKSALINRLVDRRVVESARRPGVTRQLRWIRVGQNLDLLDAPGVLPAKLDNQDAALKLAWCDDIGDAAYDNQRVAAFLIDQLNALQNRFPQDGLIGISDSLLYKRYGVDATSFTGEMYLTIVSQKRHQGDLERTAREILDDFRKGKLGAISLETPPD